MQPYLIINNKLSTDVNGLLISKLPPISKPKLRTTVEEIDGRDGDIVTVLGYAAYDKPVTIGLHGQYDEDDVISYFNTSGQVIFSNEPEKYYNFAIYEQIDLEKLLRYRTATVNFHVQPFKFSAIESEKVYNYSSTTTSATITARNSGNEVAKPVLTITGSGAITVYLNGSQVLALNLGSNQTIIIDVANMNAYDASGNYLNRLVVGDYNNLALKQGNNTVTVNGSVTRVAINKYSRWT